MRLTSPTTKSKSWKNIEYLNRQKCSVLEWHMKFPSKWLDLEGFYKNKLFFQPCTLLPLGTQWAVAADSSLLRSVCSLLSVQVALRDLGGSPFQWTFMTGPSLGSRQVCVLPLESPKVKWPGSTPANSLCLSAPTCRTRSMWLRPSAEPSSSFQAARRATSPKDGDLLSLKKINLKT